MDETFVHTSTQNDAQNKCEDDSIPCYQPRSESMMIETEPHRDSCLLDPTLHDETVKDSRFRHDTILNNVLKEI